MKKNKKLIIKLIKAFSIFIGMLANAIIILLGFYLGKAFSDNEALNVLCVSFFAYPIACLAKRYTLYYVLRLYRR